MKSIALLCLCAAATAADPLKVTSVEFTPTPAPSGEMEMCAPYTTSSAIVTLADGTKREFRLQHVVFHRSGDFVGGAYAGLIVDKDGAPLLECARDSKGRCARGPFRSAGPDGTSLLRVPGAPKDTLFLVNHLEYDTEGENIDPKLPPVSLYGRLPMTMNLTVLQQDPKTGRLTPLRLSNINFSAVGGLWDPCNGSTTPWETHLGSEEYEPDAAAFEKAPLEAMNLYLGTPGKTAKDGGANPYMYGHMVEVAVAPDGTTTAVKHFSMGRLSFELGDVMGDGKTVYFGDDGEDVIRAMYIADRENDLSAGTLYAAKLTQDDGANFGTFRMAWIRLGHATDGEVKALIDKGVAFSDIWETADAKRDGFTAIQAYTGTGGRGNFQYLRLKPGMELAAAFLETRRYAAVLGATCEFTKMEGIAHNNADRKQYTAVSYVRKPMIDGKNEKRPQDDIRLAGDEADLLTGAVYESACKGGQADTAGAVIASDWVAFDMKAIVHGRRQPADAKTGRFDKGDTDMVAGPDNLRFSEAMRTLFIGEDTSLHLNNFIWAFNVDTGATVRIFSAPAGAENTGLNVVDDAGGFAYITCNIQHPGAEEDLGGYPDEIKHDLRRKIDERGWVGYLGGMPAVTR